MLAKHFSLTNIQTAASSQRWWNQKSGLFCPQRKVLSGPEGQPAPDPFKELLHIWDVEVNVVGEVCADVGVSAQQGAVEGSPPNADHHREQTKQQQNKEGVSTHII